MKKRFGMLLALVLVVLLGMTAVAMAEKCPEGACKYYSLDHNGNRCYICNYNKADEKEHMLTGPVSNPQWSNGKDHLHSYENCSECGEATYTVKVEMDPNWHDGTACEDCGRMFKSGTITNGHTWNATTRECAVCGILCPGHEYENYFDLETGAAVCTLCHNTGIVCSPTDNPILYYEKHNEWLYRDYEKYDSQYHKAIQSCFMGGELSTHYYFLAEHTFKANNNHNVEVCNNDGIGCMVDKYGLVHENVNCPYCCSCGEGVFIDETHDGIMICNKCSKDAAGNEHKITSTTYAYKDASNHTRTEVCSCGDTIPGDEPHRYNQTGHEAPYCVCGADASGKLHSGTSAECEACEQIREENACKHRVLTGKYYTWLSAERHLMVATCKECEETIRGNEPHSYNKNWHNGTVCQYCQTDADEVKHNWLNGACSVCDEGKPEPAPIPDGLNPDDGWYYKDGVKSNFTGLAEYDGGLFYIEDGEWQKELNGLKLIGEDFWFLAGGQVQEHHGFALYDGEWFYLDGGKLDVTASGVFEYNGKSFIVAAGRLVSECTGLAQVPSGEWYYVAEGRVLTEFSGEVEYDGKLFQIVNGKLVA